jgi:hypothetical protein
VEELLALGSDEPGNNDVEKEGGDRGEHEGQQPAGGSQLRQLSLEKPERRLLGSIERPDTTILVDERFDAGDHVGGEAAPLQPKQRVVEPACQVHRGGELMFCHPEHAEPPIVGEQRARRDRVDEFWR